MFQFISRVARGSQRGGASRLILQNTGISIVARFGGLLVGLIATPVVVSLTGLSNYGIWVIVSSLVGYIGSLNLGTGGTFMGQYSIYLARNDAIGVRLVTTFGFLFYFFLFIILSPLAYLLSLALNPWFHIPDALLPVITTLYWLLYLSFFISQIQNMFRSLLRSTQNAGLVAILDLIVQVANSIVLITSLMFHMSFYSFAIATYTSLIISITANILLIRKLLGPQLLCNPLLLRMAFIKSQLSFGGWIQLHDLSYLINMETDRLLIGSLSNTREAGIYQLANKLAFVARIIPLNILGPILPTMSEMNEAKQQMRIQNAVVDASRALGLITFYLGGMVASCAYPLMWLWIDRSMRDFVPMLWVILATFAVNNLTGVGTTTLRAFGKPRLEANYAIIAAALNIILTLALIRPLGLWGILVATLIGQIAGSSYFVWKFYGAIGMSLREGFLDWIWPILISTAFSCLSSAGVYVTLLRSLHPSRSTAIVEIALIGIVYSLSFGVPLVSLRYFTPRDTHRLRELIPVRFRGAATNKLLDLLSNQRGSQ